MSYSKLKQTGMVLFKLFLYIQKAVAISILNQNILKNWMKESLTFFGSQQSMKTILNKSSFICSHLLLK